MEALTDKLLEEMVAAAERRVERQQARLDAAQKLVDEGITAQQSLESPEQELATRRMNAGSGAFAGARDGRTRRSGEIRKIERGDPGCEPHRVSRHVRARNGTLRRQRKFQESRDLKPLAVAFEKKFDRPLPISATGKRTCIAL